MVAEADVLVDTEVSEGNGDTAGGDSTEVRSGGTDTDVVEDSTTPFGYSQTVLRLAHDRHVGCSSLH